MLLCECFHLPAVGALWLIGHFTFIVIIVILTSCVVVTHVKERRYARPRPLRKVLNVQPEITDLFLLWLNVTVPNYSCSQLVILVIKDYALSLLDNRIVLSLIFAIPHDLDAHKATRPAMFQVIICRLWLGLSANCRESKL